LGLECAAHPAHGACHAFALLLIRERIILKLEHAAGTRRFQALFAIVVSATVVLLTALHGIEGAAWAFAYVKLGALPDARTAMLYSLSAMTSYGHASLFLAPHWQMMGALEALNGMMLFGLTTAFLFSVIQTVWPPETQNSGAGPRPKIWILVASAVVAEGAK
jgi:hypothetical protein